MHCLVCEMKENDENIICTVIEVFTFETEIFESSFNETIREEANNL